MSIIRVGLVGANPDYGWGGSVHAPAIGAVPALALAGVATRSKATAQAAAQAFGLDLAFDNARSLAEHPDIDVVAIAVRAPEHRPIVEAALAAGKHVFCEWPLGKTYAETQALAALADGQPAIHTAIGLQGRFSPWIRQVRDIVQSGVLGAIQSATLIASDLFSTGTVRASNAYMLDPANGANPLTIHVGHFLDAFCFALGEISSLTARAATTVSRVKLSGSEKVLQSNVPDQIALSGLLEGGGVAVFQLRAGYPTGPAAIWEIQGSEAQLRVTSPDGYLHWHPLVVELARKGQPFEPVPAPEFPLPGAAGLPPAARHVTLAYKALADDLQTGGRQSASFAEAATRHATIAKIAEDSLAQG